MELRYMLKRIIPGVIVLIAFLMGVLIFCGCSKSAPPPDSKTVESSQVKEASPAVQGDQAKESSGEASKETPAADAKAAPAGGSDPGEAIDNAAQQQVNLGKKGIQKIEEIQSGQGQPNP